MSDATSTAAAPPKRPLRLWPGVVLVLIQAFAVFGTPIVAPGTMWQLFGMIGGPFVGAVLLAVWWLFFSRASWADRLGGLALCLVAFAVARVLVHESAVLALTTHGIPVLCMVFVGWLVLSRGAALKTRRLGGVAAMLVAALGLVSVRTNGVDGTFDIDYAWRWSPTAEESFLASSASSAGGSSRAWSRSEGAEWEASWPGFRGPRRDSRIENLLIETDWEANPPKLLWRHPIGPGWSSFAVAGNHLFTQEQRGEDELVVAYDALTGDEIWRHRDRARFWESLAGAGPRGTPTFDDGRIYALGATGIFNCLDAISGEAIWTRDLTEDTGAAIPDWGFSSSPLIEDDLVVVFAGAEDGKGVIAYDKLTGEPRWTAPAGHLSYSSPHLATIGGERQILLITGDGARGFSPVTGEVLWEHAWLLEGGARIVQPGVTREGRVLIGTGFGQGTRQIRLTRDSGAWQAAEDWTSTDFKPYFNDFVIHRDHLFGFDGNILACADLDSGARKWKRGRYGSGQLLLIADQNLLLVLSERGEVVLVNADPEEFVEVARLEAITGKTWNHPVIADGRLYVRNGEEAAAFSLRVLSTTGIAEARPGS